MKKYKVNFEFIARAEVIVEAENEEEAREDSESEAYEIARDNVHHVKVRVEEVRP